jgi:glucosylceramidase
MLMTLTTTAQTGQTLQTVQTYVTAQNTAHRLSALPEQTLGQTVNVLPLPHSVIVDPSVRYQEIEGFGGSFTEAAALTFLTLPEAQRAELLRAYFDPMAGLGYTLCRTHIGACDFSLGNYSYAEVAGDVELQHFSIKRDYQALIPMIKAAQQAAPEPFRLLASPWSPPAWMKTNDNMCYGGKLRPEYRAAWALYYCRYLEAYAREGIPIWALTLQNEPMAVQTWESCIYEPEEARDFIRDYLGPTLAAHDHGNIPLLTWDHNRDQMVEWVKPTLDDPEAAKYVWGTAFHWYVADKFDNLQTLHDAYPDKKLLFTEGCQEGGPHHNEWAVGERYGRSILNDLNRWTVGWIDWNLVLDERGGPNHVGNFCSAPILVDTQKGELQYQPSYYYIGHFARFIRPGARRILSATSHDALQATAFENKDGSIVVIVLNLTDQDVPFVLKLRDQSLAAESLPHSIATYRIAGHA